MLNTKNYAEQVAYISYVELPEKLQKGYDFVKKATAKYTNWDVYYTSESVKNVMDIYFEKVSKYLPQAIKTETKKVATTHEQNLVTKPSANAKKLKATKENEVATSENNKIQFVEKLPEEIKLIKRFVNLSGKQKTQEDILRFINALQKAIIERKVRKISPNASHIEYIQNQLIETYNTMGSKITFSITDKKLNELEQIIHGEKVFPSIQYIKKYLNLIGKKGIKQKATTLLNQLVKAVESKKISKTDIYADKLSFIHEQLKEFIDMPSQKTIEIDTQELNGLQNIVEGCTCSLQGVEETLPTVMNSMDFANLQFNTIGLQGKWYELMGDPSHNFTAMVFGKPKMGKSFLCIDFAGYLARFHGKVLYVAKEEGLDLTLQMKLNDKNVKHPNLFVASTLPNNLSEYDFIFLDSVNKLGLQPHELTALKKQYPQKSFVFIFQTTKDGNFRGANSFQHDVDIVIEVPEFGKAVQYGRFNQGGEMDIF